MKELWRKKEDDVRIGGKINGRKETEPKKMGEKMDAQQRNQDKIPKKENQ